MLSVTVKYVMPIIFILVYFSMMSVTVKHFMLSIVILSVGMMSVTVKPVMLNVIIQIVGMLNVLAPLEPLHSSSFLSSPHFFLFWCLSFSPNWKLVELRFDRKTA
jgi:hypothetical protein